MYNSSLKKKFFVFFLCVCVRVCVRVCVIPTFLLLIHSVCVCQCVCVCVCDVVHEKLYFPPAPQTAPGNFLLKWRDGKNKQ